METAIINFYSIPTFNVEGVGDESLETFKKKVIEVRLKVLMIMLAKPIVTAIIIAKENNPPVKVLYSIY